MPFLNPSQPLIKATEVAKRLRTRESNESLIELLQLAKKVFQSNKSSTKDGERINIYFPGKEEWLIEWVVQRLREEEAGSSSCSENPRLVGEFWEFLGDVLRDCEWKREGQGVLALRKHGFLGLVSRAMGEAREAGIGDSRKRRKIERGAEAETFRYGKEEMKRLLKGITGVVGHLQHDNAKAGKGGRGGGSSVNVVILVLRGNLEMGAQILGDYLECVRMIITVEEEDLEEPLSGLDSIVGIWRSCVYGNAEAKKVAATFSKLCLLPAWRLISNLPASCPKVKLLEKLVTDYIFSIAFSLIQLPMGQANGRRGKGVPDAASMLKHAVKTELGFLLAPLSQLKEVGAKELQTGLEKLFQIIIDVPISGALKSSRAEVIETIFTILLELILRVEIDKDSSGTGTGGANVAKETVDIVTSLLLILTANQLPISDKTLRRIVDLIANLPKLVPHGDELSLYEDEVKWPIIELALTLDFDTFIISQTTSLLDRLVFALAAVRFTGPTSYPDDTYKGTISLKVVSLLINGFYQARNLESFLAAWSNGLDICLSLPMEARKENIWMNSETVLLFSDVVEKGFTSGKIELLLTSYCEVLEKTAELEIGTAFRKEVVLMSGLLKGVRREETEVRLETSGVLERVLKVMSSLKLEARMWREWALVNDALQIQTVLAKEAEAANKIVELALKRIKEFTGVPPNIKEKGSCDIGENGMDVDHSVPADERGMKDNVKTMLYALEVLFIRMEVDADAGEKGVSPDEIFRIVIQDLRFGVSHWDGKIESIDNSNLFTVLFLLLTKRYMRLFSLLEKETQRQFIEHFINLFHLPNKLTEGISVRDVWEDMLNSPGFYEQKTLKDTVLYELLRIIEPGLPSSEALSYFRCDITTGQPQDANIVRLPRAKIEKVNFAVASLSRYPIEAIGRKIREQFLDSLLCIDLSIRHSHSEGQCDREYGRIVRTEIRKIMASLMSAPNPACQLFSPAGIAQWFLAVSYEDWEYTAEDKIILEWSMTLARRVLRTAVNMKGQAKAQEMIRGLVQNVTVLFTDMNKAGEHVGTLWDLAAICLGALRGYADEYTTNILNSFRNMVLERSEILLSNFSKVKYPGRLLRHYRNALLSSTLEKSKKLEDERTVTNASNLTSQIMRQILPDVRNFFAAESSLGSATLGEDGIDMLMGLTSLQYILPQNTSSISPAIALTVLVCEFAKTRAQVEEIMQEFEGMVTGFSTPVYFLALKELTASCFPTPLPSDLGADGDNAKDGSYRKIKEHTSYYCSFIQILLKNINKPAGEDLKQTIDVLARTYTEIANALPALLWISHFPNSNLESPADLERELQPFSTLASTLTSFLRSHTWAVTQYNIEKTLYIITKICSPLSGNDSLHSPSSPTIFNPNVIYQSLTALLTTLILSHRHRLSGRYHLLISTIQALLQCFFIPKHHLRKKHEGVIQPFWLPSSPSPPSTSSLTSGTTSGINLDPISARSFSRVLTALCDPSPSFNVPPKHKHSDRLTSQVTRYKHEVLPPHIPNILTYYVRLQLDARYRPLDTEIREALKSGIWAVYEVLGSARRKNEEDCDDNEEGGSWMKLVNASLDAQGRVLWRKGWEEWKRESGGLGVKDG